VIVLRAASDALLSGTSGSPLIDDAGELVGIVSWAGGKVGTPGLQGMVPRPHAALPGWVWRRIQGAMSHPSA
jgi:hypothetical protein